MPDTGPEEWVPSEEASGCAGMTVVSCNGQWFFERGELVGYWICGDDECTFAGKYCY